jgi:hypothetical protein
MTDLVQAQIAQKQMQGFANVPEALTLYDTVLVTQHILKWHDGWFTSFLAAGQANSFPFLNVRNRNHHLAYNNQDTRDQMPYAMEVYSIGVDFWGPSQAEIESGGEFGMIYQQNHASIWMVDLPRHASIKFNVNQDEKLNAQCCMVPSGMGPVGGGVGQGVMAYAEGFTGGTPNPMLGMTTMGMADITCRFKFPNPIQIPRRASISAVVTLSEYGRQLLQSLVGPWQYVFKDWESGRELFKWMAYGITVSLQGKRLVQQRGQYHA